MKIAPDMLRSFVERIERLDEEGKQISDDKRDVYAEAKASGFDVKALKAVISYRRKDLDQAEEHEAIVRLYLDTLQGKSGTGTPHATRAGAHEHEPKPVAPAAPAEPVEQSWTISGARFVTTTNPVPALNNSEMPDMPAFLDRRVQA